MIWYFAVFVGFLYWLGALGRSGVAFEELAAIPKPLIVTMKGLFTFLLALSVSLSGKSRARFWISIALVLSAIGDVLLVTAGPVAGGLLFAIAHTTAGYAYFSQRQNNVTSLRWIAALSVPAIAVAASYFVLEGTKQPILMSLFPLLSGTMAALAIVSRFPLWLSGLGAAIFVQSDVLFLANLGILNGNGKLGFLTWAAYAIGYAMVARGASVYAHFQKF